MQKIHDQPIKSDLDYDRMEDQIDLLWEFLESGQYHLIQEKCQHLLKVIEQDLADDFGQDLKTETLYQDPNEERRECYLEVLHVYHKALRSLVIELIIHTDGRTEVDQNFKRYHALKHDIQGEMSKVAYLLGDHYTSRTFITPSDLDQMNKLMREHCQLILKREFFKTFKIVIQTLGNLERKNFHKVTEPYKNLRKLCEQCLNILEVMRDGRFFGQYDMFIEDYERDVKIYLQILWYLAIKTDLNKTDKFLNPNTYSRGLDAQCQVFAALLLMEQVLPHIEEARNVGLSDQATIVLLEEYAECLYKIITHEEEQIKKDGLQQLQEPDRVLAEQELKKLKAMKDIVELYTEQQEKTKYRMEFAIKLFKGTPFAFRLGEHKRIAVPNPEGRVLRHDISIEQALEVLKDLRFSTFFKGLKMKYRSRSGLKLQALRWSWFAERELQAGHFEKPKYNYLKYIHTRWKEKVQEHYSTLEQLSRREYEDEDDDDD